MECRHFGARAQMWWKVVTTDLSAGGAGFAGEGDYDVDNALEIKIQMPTMREPLVLRGRVARSRTMPTGTVECAVEFVDMSPHQRAELDELIEFLRKRI